ncbi:hypothetical protein SGPA1_50670 [Streptomyces misionensis JCM 4497]
MGSIGPIVRTLDPDTEPKISFRGDPGREGKFRQSGRLARRQGAHPRSVDDPVHAARRRGRRERPGRLRRPHGHRPRRTDRHQRGHGRPHRPPARLPRLPGPAPRPRGPGRPAAVRARARHHHRHRRRRPDRRRRRQAGLRGAADPRRHRGRTRHRPARRGRRRARRRPPHRCVRDRGVRAGGPGPHPEAAAHRAHSARAQRSASGGDQRRPAPFG